MATSTITNFFMICLLITLEIITKADPILPIGFLPGTGLQTQIAPATFPPLLRDSNTTVSTFPPLLHDRFKDGAPLNPASANDRPTSPYSIQDHTTPSSQSGPSHLDGVKNQITTTSTFPPLVHEHITSVHVDKYKPKDTPLHTTVPNQQPMSGECATAIIGCCSPTSPWRKSVDECLQFLECPGPFWGLKPCSSVAIDEAFKIAPQFYKNSKL